MSRSGKTFLWFTLGAGVYLYAKRRAIAAEINSGPPHKWGSPMKLSKNFDLSEFLHSSTMPEIATYKLTDEELGNLKRLVAVLQPIRDKYGPVTVTSGG